MSANWETVGWKGQDYGDWRYLQADGYISGWAYLLYTAPNGYSATGWYYFDPNTHIAQRGWIQDDWLGTGLAWYYLLERRAAEKGTVISARDNTLIWFDCKAVTGWIKIDGYWYYFCTKEDVKAWGAKYHECMMLQNTYMDQNGKRYYFDANGHCTNP